MGGESVQRNKRGQQGGDNGQDRQEGALGQHLLFYVTETLLHSIKALLHSVETLIETLFRQVKTLIQDIKALAGLLCPLINATERVFPGLVCCGFHNRHYTLAVGLIPHPSVLNREPGDQSFLADHMVPVGIDKIEFSPTLSGRAKFVKTRSHA